jgi:hypothetical protein
MCLRSRNSTPVRTTTGIAAPPTVLSYSSQCGICTVASTAEAVVLLLPFSTPPSTTASASCDDPASGASRCLQQYDGCSADL